MELTVKLFSVLVLGAIEIWAAIPAGLALQLNPVATGMTTAIGAVLGALVITLAGERVRAWLERHWGRKAEKGQHRLIHRVWQRYGVPGLGLLAPLLTGAPLGVVLGLMLGAPARRLLLWVSLGIVLWSAILTALGIIGLTGIKMLWR